MAKPNYPPLWKKTHSICEATSKCTVSSCRYSLVQEEHWHTGASPTEGCGIPGEDGRAGFVQPEEGKAERRPYCCLQLPYRKYRARVVLEACGEKMRGTKQKLHTRKSQLDIRKLFSQGWWSNHLPQRCAKLSQTKACSDFEAGCALGRDWARRSLPTLVIAWFYVLFIGTPDFIVSFTCILVIEATTSIITVVQHLP